MSAVVRGHSRVGLRLSRRPRWGGARPGSGASVRPSAVV